MNYITKFAVFAALLAFVSAAAVRKGPAPDVLDEVVRDSTFVDLFGVPPDVQHCLDTLADVCPAFCCDPYTQWYDYCVTLHCP